MIKYNEKSRTFYLGNEYVSYIFKILENEQLGQLYYGKAIKDSKNFDHLFESEPRPMTVCTFDGDMKFSLEYIKQEYPSYGTGDMRHPAIDILQENGSRIIDFKYQSHEIIKGKPELKDLPATYVEHDDEAETLSVSLYDDLIDAKLILTYTIFKDRPVITRNAYIENCGDTEFRLNRAMSLSLDLPDKDYDMIELTGAWSRERHIKSRKLEHGIQSIYSLRGISSANFNPFIALKRYDCNENSGEVLGFSFVYSGNFLAQVEVDTYDISRVSMGIHPHNFSWKLRKGESFQTPEVVMVYSDKGLNGMSQTFHKLYQSRLARGKFRDEARPILVNNWEGTYFDFDEEKILSMAKQSKELGVELFVLDDGWFGVRNDDTSGLGDWYPNLDKLPNGISGLSKKVTEMGIKFGLWIEPEMVNKDSELYRKHPEWTLETPNRKSSHGRHQHVLDFSNPDVIDYIYKMISKVIRESDISYIKWDMNRSLSEVYSNVHDSESQGKVMHKYVLGVYRLYEMLINEFPDILFESCSSGGSRFDPGMLYYAPQCWTSDDTDAIERLKIQYGTSLVYPLSSIGAHVSAIPNAQVFRNVPIETRANVACFGTFGYELDVNKLSEEDKKVIVEQIKFMKDNRKLLQFGTFYRLKSPFEGNETVWMVVSEDKDKAIVGYYKTLQKVNCPYNRVKLQGLDPEKKYEVSINDYEAYGDELMNVGMITTDRSSGEQKDINKAEGDYSSRLYILTAK
ncbi:Alpha-galactosidase [Anaerococcus prevotii]|uniref:Alpha-galactosidase n=1 Tax=Anaerococcus prevotii (strain ATCC 9321 / DSM 20548 / JCM 6508 / NCTC 11806 / PC1) TaxID=525919 RepID=C7RF65_ANAPD|nr:alpha-galactosidase [Anaerococcus prevotii]ACV28126.1 glycoside hydrolase clan GH-D [Anaerococcus prevotii DSM 20548]SUU93677.1 Alpha-galactosidase [Anaerococcus prevotii]